MRREGYVEIFSFFFCDYSEALAFLCIVVLVDGLMSIYIT